jgi:hypothetical protein
VNENRSDIYYLHLALSVRLIMFYFNRQNITAYDVNVPARGAVVFLYKSGAESIAVSLLLLLIASICALLSQ